MKLTILLLTLGFLQVSATGFSQKVNYYGKKVSLESVFTQIEKETGFVFMYKEGILNDAELITIKATNEPIEDFLERLFTNLPYDYSVVGKSIFVSRKSAAPLMKPADALIIRPGESMYASEISLLVVDDGFAPLNGATVEVLKSKKLHLTDAKGSMKISVEEGSVIKISYVGYISQEIKITASHLQTKILRVVMKKSAKSLDETQVVAYGSTTRRFNTGSIGTVKAEDIERQPVMNVLQALEGRVAGLNITASSGNSASPMQVEIRGRTTLNPDAITEPLYVVDGRPLPAMQVSMFYGKNQSTGSVQAGRTYTKGESPLYYLNPNDIESVDVLKDADATAIYGARGANGVILITTKKGKAGPTQFSLRVDNAYSMVQKKVELLNTEEYLAIRREAFRNDGSVPDPISAPDLTLFDQTKYTDWQDIFYAPANQTGLGATISGGVGQNVFSLSAGYGNEAVLNNNGGKNHRINLSGSFAHTSKDQKFTLSFAPFLTLSKVAGKAEGQSILAPPNAPDIYNERGELNFEPYRTPAGSKYPFGSLRKWSDSRSNSFTTGLNMRYEIMKGLNVSIAGSYGFTGNDNGTFEPTAAVDPKFPNPTGSGAFFGKTTTRDWRVEPMISYDTYIGKGKLNVQLGGSLFHTLVEGITVVAVGFPNDNLMRSPNNAGSSMTVEGSGEYKFTAGFALLDYRWDNKYVLSLSGRRDGSSKFGPGKQFGNFGSVGLAWIATEEKWVKKVLPDWFSYLKFAGNTGLTGGDNVGEYEYLTRWGAAVSLNGTQKVLDYNGTPAIHSITLTNPDFRWESTTKLDAMVSIGLLDDIINIEGVWYRWRSANQLTQAPIPMYTGFTTVRANWDAVVENSGLELTIQARFKSGKNWRFTGGFNIGTNKNTLVSFPGIERVPSFASKYEVGKSLFLKYLFKYTGINPLTGDYTFEDHNKDGVVSFPNGNLRNSIEDDRYIVYDLNPKYTGGFNFSVSYKSLTLSTGLSFKRAMAQDPFIFIKAGGYDNLYVPQEVKDNHWKKPGDIAKYPKYTTGTLNARLGSSDAGYQNASYLHMNSLTLAYSLPQQLISRLKMKSCMVSVRTQNIFTITTFRGIDPRLMNMLQGNPIPRVISTTLSVNF